MVRVGLGEVMQEELAKAFCYSGSGVIGVEGLYVAEDVGG